MALKPCPHCGNHISDKATKCPKCGAELSEKDFAKNVNIQQEEETSLESFDYNEEPSPRNKRWMMIVLPIIIIALVAGGVFYFFNEKKKSEAAALAEQIRQDSILAAQKEAERLEQLRQDSIKASEERIEKAILHWDDFLKYDSTNGYEVLNNKKIKNKLLSKDFEQTNHHKEYITDTSWGDFWEETWTYTFFKDKENKEGKLYEVVVYNLDCIVEIKVYDSSKLTTLREEISRRNVSKLPNGGEDEWKQIGNKGNSIYINFCGD